jgi:hypothetical protein
MKKSFILFLLFIFFQTVVYSQKERRLKKVLELKIPREGGTNGASVAWNPVTKKYYAAVAGSSKNFIGVYDASGKLISPASLETGCDLRGIWYNDSTKTLQLNGYKDFGWAEYVLDSNGFPSSIKMLYPGLHQPNDQSVGAYNAAKNHLYFLLENTVLTYDFATATLLDHPIELKPEEEKKKQEEKKAGEEGEEDEEEGGEFNTTALIYTGIKGSEFGMINFMEKRILLFNAANGRKKAELELPKGAPIHELLNFAYCNGIYWLFDKKERSWKGYK